MPFTRPRQLRVRLAVGAGILLATVVLIERYLGWAELLRPWRDQPATALVIGTVLVLASYGARAVRLYDHFQPTTGGRFGACLRLTLIHNLLNNLVPMRLGEASFPVLLHRYFALPLVSGTAGLLWFRLTDVHILAAAALLALGAEPLGAPTLALLLMAWMTLPWLLFRLRDPAEQLVQAHARGPLARRLVQALAGLPADAPTFWRTFLWTALNWALKLAVFAWLLQAFGGTALGPSVLGALGGELSSVLPVHGLAGVGTYEAGVVAGLSPFGVPAREAVAAAVNLHLFVLGVSGIGGLWALTLARRDGTR